tara:strand:- start:86 stop:292 length:207 start_codon:yes stop_codon:yes gene_type:complete
MGSRTSEMAVMSPRRWGYTKVNIFFGQYRIAEDQDLVMRGECFIDSKGNLWEFYSRKDDTIRAYPIKL